MKIKFSQILTALFLLLAFILFKTFNIFSIIFFIIVVLIDSFTDRRDGVKNLLYLIVALSVFPSLLSLFLIYLPFAIFGLLLAKKNFIKSYILGFAVSFLPTILLYTVANYLNFSLTFFTISLFLYLPVIIGLLIIFKKKRPLDFIAISYKEYFIILAILLSTMFVAANIIDDQSLFTSNGTYLYTRFELIVKNIDSYNTFPIYDPATSSGESPFLFETPLTFSHIAFANILLNFIPPVLFYNLYTVFILFLSVLSLTQLIKSIIGDYKENWTNSIIITIGALTIGLNFQFVQLLESFKQFSGFPINYLILSIILEKPKTLKEILTLFYMIVLTSIIHVTHAIGIVLISVSLFFLILFQLYRSKRLLAVKNWLFKNKVKLIAGVIILFFLPAFYTASSLIFEEFLEPHNKEIDWDKFLLRSSTYIGDFLRHGNHMSLEYPDLNRNDDQRFGPFISVFGLISLIGVSILYKLKRLSNIRLFFGAYLLHFFMSSIIINHPMVTILEYAYRTAQPYFLILLVASISVLILIIKNKNLKVLLALMFLVTLLYTMPLVRENLQNIHREEIISGKIFENEINFAKNLPRDGRIITYGIFANAVDPAMASLTGRYFSRYHMGAYDLARYIYAKIHDSNAWGASKTMFNMSGIELSNYLRFGGYKYIFANICHPVGDLILKKLYPDFSYLIYTSPENSCFVFLAVNGTHYAEKVSVLEKIDRDLYKTEGGYKYLTLSEYHDFGSGQPYSQEAIEPIGLEFKRISPTQVEIYGNFNDNDWVTFKEGYFSRWKAYMGGKEVPVLANNHNLILIKTIKGRVIKLRYIVLPIERFFGTLSLISAIIALAALIIFLRD